ncbi:MAG: response regulator [Firmicutes bacterium]|nr:response regulator [[Eubacterium] siraeum]MCM1487286.1 response regulator [Bacillota bacterium]
MNYKILINGRNTVLARDVIRYTSDDCTSFSTSDEWQDIITHIRLTQPDAYVALYPKDDGEDQMINQLVKLSEEKMCEKTAFVIVCDPEQVEDIEKKSPYLNLLKITRPTSAQEIENRTVEFIRALEMARLKEEKKQLEMELAAKAHREELKAQEEAKRKAQEEEKAQIKKAKEKSLAALASDSGKSGSKSKSQGKTSESAKTAENALDVKKHILIVDDDRNVLKLLKTTLSEKYEVTAMLNGKMAEKYLDTKTADLILLDHEMPVESGFEVFQKIRENKARSNIPVVFLTGTSDSKIIGDILALHPKGYLLKPVDVDKLMTTIADALK